MRDARARDRALLRCRLVLQLPDRHPDHGVCHPHRFDGALATVPATQPAQVPAVALALFHAYWAKGEDITTDPVLAAAVLACGRDPDATLAAIDAPETKNQLRATTDEAVRRGAFGAPSLFVGDTLFFGSDRLPLLEDHLAARARGGA